MNRDAPIGVWDSGIGGLTVVRALTEVLPRERFVYFGDTARVPYGSKSVETITRFSVENTLFLLKHGIKCLVVACNTASSTALETLRRRFDLPIVGMIDSAAAAAARLSPSGRIGVLGTLATAQSDAYGRAIRAARPGAEVVTRACPLFVPFAEEGWLEHNAVRLVAEEYLAPLTAARVDTVILGCTHYPLLASVIQRVLGPAVRLVDSGREAARETADMLAARRLARDGGAPEPEHVFYVSDLRVQFERVGESFLGRPLGPVTVVDQTDLPWYERTPSEARAVAPETLPA